MNIENKFIDDMVYIPTLDMMKTIDNCIENQGKNERIKTTPFPRQYGFFSKSFIIIFILISNTKKSIGRLIKL